MEKSTETFVPNEILTILDALRAKNGWTSSTDYSGWLKENKPNVPPSTRTRWARAFAKGVAHANTPDWHIRYREEGSIVPSKFSAIRNKHINDERAKWESAGQIRYVNTSDFHRPLGDGALLTLMTRIVRDFEPNIFPCFSDWLDMDKFSQHDPKPGNATHDYDEDADEEFLAKRKNKFLELETLSLETIQLIKSAVPENCTLLNLWGNHEQWLLRDLLGEHIDQEFGEYYIDKFFTMLDNENILWIDGERNHWFPITKLFWVGHGHRGRSGYGKTAQGYLNLVRNAASVATGHTHRQEVVYVPVPYEGQRFSAVAGTLGQVQPVYANREFMGHSWGFQLITHPIHTSKGAHVEDVRIQYREGFYTTTVYGKEYSEQAMFEYDEYMDFI